MSQPVIFHFDIDGTDFTSAGQASVQIKKHLRQLDFDPDTIRRVSIAMYEGEINMVIHASGGAADVTVSDQSVEVVLSDHGPGIPDVELAMQEGYSTAKESIRALGFGAGMGLPNLKRYSDEMTIDTTPGVGTTVRLSFHVKA